MRKPSIHPNATHGLWNTSEYRAWQNIRQRCYNAKAPNYRYYGLLGIRVCPRWLDSFEAFLEDMGPKPGAEYSIERKDTKGHYEPKNCYWATAVAQNNNTSRNRLLEYEGQTLTVAEWARELGCSRETLHRRLSQGKSIEQALTVPLRGYTKEN